MTREIGKTLASIASLDERTRRDLYLFVRSRGRPTTREEAASHVGISVKLAAFHLDKLVRAGLLDAGYGRPGERRVVGRRPKVYAPSDLELSLSVPPRRYDLVGEILLEAIAKEQPQETAEQAARRVAFQKGQAAGEAAAGRTLDGMSQVEQALEDHGFEPYREAGSMRLRNCPFHRLASQEPEIVCAVNRAFVAGVVRGTGEASVAELDPRDGECCVRVTTAGDRRDAARYQEELAETVE